MTTTPAKRERQRLFRRWRRLHSRLQREQAVPAEPTSAPSPIDEWYTPPELVETCRTMMGSIDCDPASCDEAQFVVRAKVYHTYQDNGLLQPWYGNILLNPPRQRGLMNRFIDKLLHEIAAGHVIQAILLVHSSGAGSKWFEKARTESQCFCLLSQRILYWSPYNLVNGLTAKGNKQGASSGSMFFYFGPNGKRFRKVFGGLGTVT